MNKEKTQPLYGLQCCQIKRENAIGYCRLHKCHLTQKTIKQHACLQKQCTHLKKHGDNPFWKRREDVKRVRQAKKEKIDHIVEKSKSIIKKGIWL